MKHIALIAALAAAGSAAAAGDPEAGKTLYVQCAACHSLDPAQTSMGPPLKGLIGRKAGGVEDYVYSPPMRRSTVIWSAETLDAFLVDPQAVVPGSKMPFAGLASDKDRADLIAYLSAP